jgi:hypothetical protein
MSVRERVGKIAAVAAVLALLSLGAPAGAHEGEPGGHLGGALSFADPEPALGISYEWTLFLHRKERASLVWHVGAKSWQEPSNPPGLEGWTHTSNWIAIELEEPARLKVTVERQQGVVISGLNGPEVARAELVPAVSLYAGWDETSDPEDHVFNNIGNFWSTVQFLAYADNKRSKPKLAFQSKGKLPAGRYSLVIGGNPPSLGDPVNYPVGGCDPVDPVCYAYTGSHGYRALVEAK